MQSTPTRSRGQLLLRWGRVLCLGVALGLLQLLLLHQADALGQWSNSGSTAVGVSALLYLLVPGFEGFFTALRNRDISSATRAGLLVGVLSLLVVVGGVIIASALTPPPPPCLPRESCGLGLGSAAIASIGPAVLFVFFVTEGFGAIVCGLLGARIGGLLGERLASR